MRAWFAVSRVAPVHLDSPAFGEALEAGHGGGGNPWRHVGLVDTGRWRRQQQSWGWQLDSTAVHCTPAAVPQHHINNRGRFVASVEEFLNELNTGCESTCDSTSERVLNHYMY